MAHLVSETKLVYSCCGVTAADDGGSICFSQSFRYSDSTFCQNRVLEYTHRSVPNNSLSCLSSLCEQFCRFRSDIQADLVSRDILNINIVNRDLSIDRVRESVSYSCVYRQNQLLAQLLSLSHHFLTVVDLLFVNQRLTDLKTLSL